jgi:hypothetical protein
MNDITFVEQGKKEKATHCDCSVNMASKLQILSMFICNTKFLSE